MSLNVDLSALHAAVRRMGAELREFDIGHVEVPIDPIDIELEKGFEADLSQIEFNNGLPTIQGRQVLLYIQDHAWRLNNALRDRRKGNRFHVADCRKLKEMREKGRYERYVVTNDLSGSFFISGMNADTRIADEGHTSLQVCQFCVSMLNYKGAGLDAGTRRRVAETFDITDFFETYSSFFTHLPRRKAGDAEEEAYTADWEQVAARFKADRDFICESCGVDLTHHKNLLHVHHMNGVKSDNRPWNLEALCVSCHREQPHHGHLFVRHQDTQLINRLRREQGQMDRGRGDWEEVLRLCDPALAGLVKACQAEGAPAPEVGVDVQDRDEAVVANLELAWPRAKVGVAIADEDRDNAKAQGWEVWTMIEALERMADFVDTARRWRR